MKDTPGVVISDLHYFSTRSNAEERLEEIHRALETAEICVLNGDIFDFRWTRLPSIQATVSAALDWLRVLLKQYSQCSFHYVLGNHDSLRAFVHHFPELATEYANFSWDARQVRIGTHLFLHGDIIHAGRQRSDELDRYRERFEHEHPQRDAFHHLYSGVVLFRLHKVALVLNRPKIACERLLEYYRKHNPELLEGTTDIYFGHTHSPFSNFRYEGISFHNTGSMIRGLSHNILRFDPARPNGSQKH